MMEQVDNDSDDDDDDDDDDEDDDWNLYGGGAI